MTTKRSGLRSALVALSLVAGLVFMAGCGSSSSSSSSSETTPAASTSTPESTTSTGSSTSSAGAESSAGSGQALKVAADPSGELKFDTTSLSAKAGKVTIDFANTSSTPHNLTIESSTGESVGATPTISGESKSLSATPKPGTYKFFCSVPGHRQAGMEGTITVK